METQDKFFGFVLRPVCHTVMARNPSERKNGMKNKKIIPTAVLLTVAVLTSGGARAQAAPAQLVPVGQAVGIELKCEGVVVSGYAEVETENGPVCPAKAAGILPGDRIVALNGESVCGGQDFLEKAAKLSGEKVTLRAVRSQQELELTVTPRRSQQGTWQLGMWLRDGVQGVGTVTFWDPATGEYGALGHGVSLPECQGLLPMTEGVITGAEVVDVLPGQKGEPGELCGVPKQEVLGSVEENTPQGIFGRTNATLSGRKAIPVASDSEIHPGPAVILSTVDASGPREFTVEIQRVDRSGAQTRQIVLCVTDPALLERTGGIVQGMSGSPILQDGKLVGAVTHVLVDNPARGYGISMENMLRAGSALKSAA